MNDLPFEVLCSIASEIAMAGYVRYCAPLSCASRTMRDAARSARASFSLVIRPGLAASAQCTARTIASVRPAHVVFHEARLFLGALDLVPRDVLAGIETAWYKNTKSRSSYRRPAIIRASGAPSRSDGLSGTACWCGMKNATDLAVPGCGATDNEVEEILLSRKRTYRMCVSRNINVTRLPCASVCAALVELRIASTAIADLAPLRGARNLRALDASSTRVRDLAPVESLMEAGSLRAVNIAYAPIATISRVCATTVVDPRILDMAFVALRGIMRTIKEPVCEVTPNGWAVWSSLDPLDTFVSVEVTD
jgi:hypothetical protein